MRWRKSPASRCPTSPPSSAASRRRTRCCQWRRKSSQDFRLFEGGRFHAGGLKSVLLKKGTYVTPAIRLSLGALLAAATLFRQAAAADDAQPANINSIRVAVFHDSGVSEKISVLLSLLKTFPELTVTEVKAEDIRGGKLTKFDVVLFPGGSGSKEGAALEEAGCKEVKAFVERGGGFLAFARERIWPPPTTT